jgi:hypothetical protein
MISAMMAKVMRPDGKRIGKGLLITQATRTRVDVVAGDLAIKRFELLSSLLTSLLHIGADDFIQFCFGKETKRHQPVSSEVCVGRISMDDLVYGIRNDSTDFQA